MRYRNGVIWLAVAAFAGVLTVQAAGEVDAGSVQVSNGVSRGVSKAQVEKVFGAPEKILSEIGEPPISRWVYKDFTIYFESDSVVHTVFRDKKSP